MGNRGDIMKENSVIKRGLNASIIRAVKTKRLRWIGKSNMTNADHSLPSSAEVKYE
jgi:hypothetical protein